MRRAIDRVVLQEIVGPFFGSVLLFTSLFLAAGELQRLAEFSQRGVSTLALVQLVVFTMPYILAYTIPMAMLLATLLGFGRLSGDSEVVALFAAGVSFPRVMVPVVLFALSVAVPVIVINQSIIPAANHRRETMISAVRERGSTAASSRDAFTLPVQDPRGGFLLVHARGGVTFGRGGVARLSNLGVLIFDKGECVSAVRADNAEWKIGTRRWRLSDDMRLVRFAWNAVFQSNQIDIQERELELGTPEELGAMRWRVTELSTPQLYRRAKLLHAGGEHSAAREAEVEAAARTSFPLAALVFAMVGAPLGVQRTRSGKGMGFGFSVIITFVYWTLVQLTQSLGKGGTLPAVLACQLPNLMGITLGCVLIARVTARGAVN